MEIMEKKRLNKLSSKDSVNVTEKILNKIQMGQIKGGKEDPPDWRGPGCYCVNAYCASV
jgi:hypothetical protein